MIRERSSAAIGALASLGGAIFDGPVMTEDFRILKSQITAGFTGGDAGEGEGLQLYLCNGELSLTESIAPLTLNGPLDRNDRLSEEVATRQVHLVGAVGANPDPAAVEMRFVNEHGGPVIKDKFRWTYSNPEGWHWLVFNASPASVATGATFWISATHFGVWVT